MKKPDTNDLTEKERLLPKMLWECRRNAFYLQLELDELRAKILAMEDHLWSQDPDYFDDVPF